MSPAKVAHPTYLDKDNVFLIGEIAKKGAARSVDCLGNFVNGGLLVALLVKELNSYIKQSPSYQSPLLFTQCFLGVGVVAVILSLSYRVQF
jgi:hypothetical protein